MEKCGPECPFKFRMTKDEVLTFALVIAVQSKIGALFDALGSVPNELPDKTQNAVNELLENLHKAYLIIQKDLRAELHSHYLED